MKPTPAVIPSGLLILYAAVQTPENIKKKNVHKTFLETRNVKLRVLADTLTISAGAEYLQFCMRICPWESSDRNGYRICLLMTKNKTVLGS